MCAGSSFFLIFPYISSFNLIYVYSYACMYIDISLYTDIICLVYLIQRVELYENCAKKKWWPPSCRPLGIVSRTAAKVDMGSNAHLNLRFTLLFLRSCSRIQFLIFRMQLPSVRVQLRVSTLQVSQYNRQGSEHQYMLLNRAPGFRIHPSCFRTQP